MAKEKRQHGRTMLLVVLLLAAGILLMLYSGREEWGAVDSGADNQSWQSYIAALEEKAVQLCGQVSGISDVTVAVSLAQGVEYVYADQDRSYGSRDAMLLTERPPQISGIGVVCRGAEDPAAKQALIALLSAAFGVGSHRIYIASAG